MSNQPGSPKGQLSNSDTVSGARKPLADLRVRGTHTNGLPTRLARKKLPWLDGPHQYTSGTNPGEVQGLKESPTDDLTLRAIGSTPSLRDPAACRVRPRTLSLNSDTRPGLRPAVTRQTARRVLGVASDLTDKPEYSASEYSATISWGPERMQPVGAGASKRRSSRAAPASYQRPLPDSRHAPARPQKRTKVKPDWLKSRLALPLNDIAPASVKRRCVRSGSCQSCLEAPTQQVATMAAPIVACVHEQPAKDHAMPPQDGTMRTKPVPLSRIKAARDKGRTRTLKALPLMTSSRTPSPESQAHSQSPYASKPAAKAVTSDESPKGTPKPLLLPPARRKALRREKRALDREIDKLDDLMSNAMATAHDAAKQGKAADVTLVLDNAAAALQRANGAIPRDRSIPIGSVRSPPLLFPRESGQSNSSDSSSPDESPMHSREPSAETAPTLLTAQSSAQPIVVGGYAKKDGNVPVSRQVSVENASSGTRSISQTPPRLYQPASKDSVVKDFAYHGATSSNAQAARALSTSRAYGEAAAFYRDHGESVATQPGLRNSLPASRLPDLMKPLPALSTSKPKRRQYGLHRHVQGMALPRGLSRASTNGDIRVLEHAPTQSEPPKIPMPAATIPVRKHDGPHRPHISEFFEPSHYSAHAHKHEKDRAKSTVTDTRSHISLKEEQGFSLGRYYRRQPIAREWHTSRKRITASVACVNTVFIGLIAGIYAGEVPKIQYILQDDSHKVILGNVLLFACLGISTLIFWPLPLLHGRKPYTLLAFALMLPLQFPQALSVTAYRNPSDPLYRCGLLIPRALSGLAMGLANINQLPTLFDLFGCSLMSERPHQEVVVADDVRRQGGGVGIWLGIWSFCFVGSLSIGFGVGACIISGLDPSWGFYIIVMLLAVFMLINVITPETRRAPYRRSIAHFFDETEPEKLKRRVARGEVKLHISNSGPKWWFEEVWAGIVLTKRMITQPGFFVLMLYIGWIYAQVTLAILLLGALLSRNYTWQPQYVGAASLSLAVGALFALPLAKASIFSRARHRPQRTDSMTMRPPRLTWSSHLMRRCIFMLLLPLAGLAYTLSSPGPDVSWSTPTGFCGLVGFLSNLAIAECVGLIMEVWDTCDLQPGVNSKHRLQSLTETTRRRRTNYSSFPRVCAGFFAAQSLGFFLAATATGVSGTITRALGAQISIAATATILLVLTLMFMVVMVRFKEVQVIPTGIFERATKKGSIAWGPGANDPDWKPVVLGNPSGKLRRMNLLELGGLTRWTEIRKLNKLLPG